MANNFVPYSRHIRQYNWLMILLVIIFIVLIIIGIVALMRYLPAEKAVESAINFT
ncbi:hypothetical protein KY311_03415 [Candidatus Woesearchaeota archaeon]|nr:hypothetical protein [Candidatus Woesearchaeota archaeon]MBW3017307.1 hypothetical protein [Candidatus Woesearchaeota archaeon]